jgi:hypothetical protein
MPGPLGVGELKKVLLVAGPLVNIEADERVG